MQNSGTVKIWIGSITQQELFYDYILNIINADGNYLPSDFQEDWEIEEFDLKLWKSIWKERKKPLHILLKNMPHWASFKEQVDYGLKGNCAILIYHPIKKMYNEVASIMNFIGEYGYRG